MKKTLEVTRDLRTRSRGDREHVLESTRRKRVYRTQKLSSKSRNITQQRRKKSCRRWRRKLCASLDNVLEKGRAERNTPGDEPAVSSNEEMTQENY